MLCRPFSFHSLNDRQGKFRLHAVNDTTTAKIYKRMYLHYYKQWYTYMYNQHIEQNAIEQN